MRPLRVMTLLKRLSTILNQLFVNVLLNYRTVIGFLNLDTFNEISLQTEIMRFLGNDKSPFEH